MTDIEVQPSDHLPEVLQQVRAARGGQATLRIAHDSPVLLTASEFRALAAEIDAAGVDLVIDTLDPLRRQLAGMYGIPVSQIVVAEAAAFVADPVEPFDLGYAGTRATPYDVPPEEGTAPPEPKPKRGFPWLPLLGLLALVAGGFALAWFFLPSATITITPAKTQVTAEVPFSVVAPGSNAPAGGLAVPGEAVGFDLTTSQTAPVTGTQSVGDAPAAGSVEFRNPGPAPVAVPAGASLVARGGATYTLDEAVTVPAATNGASGSANGAVTAAQPGTVGNLEAGMLAGKLDSGVYYSNRDGALTGGTDTVRQVVSQQDVDALRQAAIDTMTSRAQTEPLPDGRMAVTSSVAGSGGAFQFDHQVGEEATQLTIDASMHFDAVVYDPVAVRDAAIPNLQAPTGYQLDPQSVTVTGTTGTGESLVATVSGDATQVVPDADRQAIAASIAGKSEAEAAAILDANPLVTGWTITYAPGWLPERIPGNADRIDVVVAP